MNTQSDTFPESQAQAQAASAAGAPKQPRGLYWSVRRELWENRYLYATPVFAAAVAIFGTLLHAHKLPATLKSALTMDPWHQRATIVMPYDIAGVMILLSAVLVGAYYSLDALYSERRDRSVLFWKSLPVSDLTTVLSKASVPLVILPVFTFGLIVVTQILMLLLNSLVLASYGVSSAPVWAQIKFTQSTVCLLYGLTAITLWHAPIYGWFLLVSSWAKRTPLLWAVVPFFILVPVEQIALGTHHVMDLIVYRLFGWFSEGFIREISEINPLDPLDLLAPAKFIRTPGLWFGLIATAIFLLAAARMRRYREPV
jgi:ABC-2 type transport system permease protein